MSAHLLPVINAVNRFVWGPIMLMLLVGTGVWFTFGTGFFQIRHFGHVVKNTLGQMLRRKKAKEGTITSFAALSTALAGTVGTGNVVGVATAIASGGPGAVFWMWASAFFGMMTKYAEVVLALRYRERNAAGEWMGGPMYYIKNGLGKRWSSLAALFAFFGVLAAFGIGNIAQVNSIAAAVQDSMEALGLTSSDAGAQLILRPITGIAAMCLAGLVLMGGLKCIGRATTMMVPVMSVLYILGALFVLMANADKLAAAFADIISGAFRLRAAAGGLMGYTIKQSARYGVARGVFSNEAGIGSSPIAHACADVQNPVRQGMYGILEVFVDTFVVCTLTALVILSSGVFGGTSASALMAGAPMPIAAFETAMGGFGRLFISICIVLFAFSSLLSWALYGQRCIVYLLGPRSVRLFLAAFLVAIPIGAVMQLDMAWDISDALNGLMAVPNLIALLCLSGVVLDLTKKYSRAIFTRSKH